MAEMQELVLYGEVTEYAEPGHDFGEPVIAADRVISLLHELENQRELVVRINSGGGNLEAGLKIYNALREFPGRVVVKVDGTAASAASVIAMAGDEVQVYPGSILMIHCSAFELEGKKNSQDLKREIRDLEASDRGMAAIYSEKSGLDVGTILSMMKKTTWMTGSEAIAAGFADTMIERSNRPTIDYKNRTIAAGSMRYHTASWDCPFFVKGADHMSKDIRKIFAELEEEEIAEDLEENTASIEEEGGEEEQPIAEDNEESAEDESTEEAEDDNSEECAEENEEEMTAARLAELYPDQVEAIRMAAIEEEQARIASIEEIEEEIADEDVIHEAKYGQSRPTAAKALYASVIYKKGKTAKAGKTAGKKTACAADRYLAALKADRQKSGAAKVRSNPKTAMSAAKKTAEDEAFNFMQAYLSKKGVK